MPAYLNEFSSILICSLELKDLTSWKSPSLFNFSCPFLIFINTLFHHLYLSLSKSIKSDKRFCIYLRALLIVMLTLEEVHLK